MFSHSCADQPLLCRSATPVPIFEDSSDHEMDSDVAREVCFETCGCLLIKWCLVLVSILSTHTGRRHLCVCELTMNG